MDFFDGVVFSTCIFLLIRCIRNLIKEINDFNKEFNEKYEKKKENFDITYRWERYNIIRRACRLNGEEEKERMLARPSKMSTYIMLLTDNGKKVGEFCVDGKISYLVTDNQCVDCEDDEDIFITYSQETTSSGIYFFTTDGKYIEWTGKYIYSTEPLEADIIN